MSERFIAGLDAGTSKVCVAVARMQEGRSEIVGKGVVLSSGIKKGTVVDLDDAARSVGEAVRAAEADSGVKIEAAYAGISGSHIRCLFGCGSAGIKGEISEGDIERAVAAASSLYVPLERDVLHVFPSGFAVDGQGGVERPLGLSGAKLDARVCVITAFASAVENLRKCCERAGVRTAEAVFGPVASGMAVLRPGEIASGALLLDIGAGKTDMVLYKAGMIRYAGSLAIGGNHITSDIAFGLQLPLDECERLKKEYWNNPPDEEAGFEAADDRARLRRLDEIIRPRCEEIFELAKKDIWLYDPPSSVVLTGGASLLRGIEGIAAELFGVPVRVGRPEGDMPGDPAYSACAGLVMYGLKAEEAFKDDIVEAVVGKIRGFAGGLFGKNLKPGSAVKPLNIRGIAPPFADTGAKPQPRRGLNV